MRRQAWKDGVISQHIIDGKWQSEYLNPFRRATEQIQIQNENLLHWRWITAQSMVEEQCSQLAIEALFTNTQKSWGQQGGHLSLVRAKWSMSLLKTTGTAGESHKA